MILFILHNWPYFAIGLVALVFTGGATILSRLLALLTPKPTPPSPIQDLLNQPIRAGQAYVEVDHDELAFSDGIPIFQALVLLRDHLLRCKVDEKTVDQLIDPIAPLLLRTPAAA